MLGGFGVTLKRVVFTLYEPFVALDRMLGDNETSTWMGELVCD